MSFTLEQAYQDLMVRYSTLEQEYISIHQQVGQYVATKEQQAADHAASLLVDAAQQIAALTQQRDQYKEIAIKNNGKFEYAKSKCRKAMCQASSFKAAVGMLELGQGQHYYTEAQQTLAKCQHLEVQLKVTLEENKDLKKEINELYTEAVERNVELSSLKYEQEMEIASLKKAQAAEIADLKKAHEEELKKSWEASARANQARKSARREARSTKRVALRQKQEGQNKLSADFRAAVVTDCQEKLVEEISLAEADMFDRIRAHYCQKMTLEPTAAAANPPGLVEKAVYKTSTAALDAAMAHHKHIGDIAARVLEAHKIAQCVDQAQAPRASRRGLEKQSLEMAKLKNVEEQLNYMSKKLEKKSGGEEEEKSKTATVVETAASKEKGKGKEKPGAYKSHEAKKKKRPVAGKLKEKAEMTRSGAKTLRTQIREQIMEVQVAELLAYKKSKE